MPSTVRHRSRAHLRVQPAARAARLCAFSLACLALAAPAGAQQDDGGAATTAGHYFCKFKPTYLMLGIAETGPDLPTTKFQFSFRYMLWDFTPEGVLERRRQTTRSDEARRGQIDQCGDPASNHQLMFGYTQKSLWRLYEVSSPFEENNYNPELFYSYEIDWGHLQRVTFGLEHESNGEGGSRSRSWNRVYFEAKLRFRFWPIESAAPAEVGATGAPRRLDPRGRVREDRWELRSYVKIWWITPLQLSENEDIDDFIGFFKLTLALTTPDYEWGSLALDAELTKGGDAVEVDHGSALLGLSYGLHQKFWRFVPYVYVQYFEGYGETLIRYDRHTRALRAGIHFVR